MRCTDGGLGCARVWTVGNALRMQRKRTDFDSLARLVVALDIVEDLVGIEVGVVVGNHDRQRMKIERARAERTDDEVVRLEGLMRWRRHVVLANDWAEIVDVEAVRVVATVPADNIKRVVVVHVRVHLIAALDAHFERALLVESHRHFRQTQVALAVGRVL